MAALSSEVNGITCVKLFEGYSEVAPSSMVRTRYGARLLFLRSVLESIDIHVAYVAWPGADRAPVTGIAMVVFDGQMALMKPISGALIVFGIAGPNVWK